MKRYFGFTMTEMLVVTMILLILAGLLMPVLMQAKGRAKETTCISNLKQVGYALELYRADWGEYSWQGNQALNTYLGNTALMCPVINVPNVFSNYLVCAMVKPQTEIWEGEQLDHVRDLMDCREKRQGDIPLVVDDNHLPRIVRVDDQLGGRAYVYRANGSVSSVSRKRAAEVDLAMSGLAPNAVVPCHRRYRLWNL